MFSIEICKIREEVQVGPDIWSAKEGLEFSEESGVDATRSSQILFMELGDSLLGIGQVLSGFPGVVAFAVAFPADKVLELALEHATVDDHIDFILFFALNCDRFRRR